MKKAEAHLLLATKARSYLKEQVASAKRDLKSHFIDKGLELPTVGARLAPACNNISMHFSFDFAQQVFRSRFTITELMYSTGTLPIRPSAARPNVLSNPKEVWDLWDLL